MPDLDAVGSDWLRSTISLRTKQTLAYSMSGAFGRKEGTGLNFIGAADDDDYRNKSPVGKSWKTL
jgi:hypothetical protein